MILTIMSNQQPSSSRPPSAPATARGGWSLSSWDLQDGAEVVESDDATLSALFDAPPPAAAPAARANQADPAEPL